MGAPDLGSDGEVRLVLNVPDDTHRSFKLRAATDGLEMRQLFLLLCRNAGITVPASVDLTPGVRRRRSAFDRR